MKNKKYKLSEISKWAWKTLESKEIEEVSKLEVSLKPLEKALKLYTYVEGPYHS